MPMKKSGGKAPPSKCLAQRSVPYLPSFRNSCLGTHSSKLRFAPITVRMTRSRYRIYETEYPFFMTCTRLRRAGRFDRMRQSNVIAAKRDRSGHGEPRIDRRPGSGKTLSYERPACGTLSEALKSLMPGTAPRMMKLEDFSRMRSHNGVQFTLYLAGMPFSP